MPSDFKFIASISVEFLEHAEVKDAHKYLNGNYADNIPEIDDLFTDGSARTAVSPDVLTIMRRKISEELISPIASETTNPSIIAPLINNCVLKAKYHGGPTMIRIRNHGTFENLLHDAYTATPTATKIRLFLGISHFHIDTDHIRTYLDWQYISTTPFPAHTVAPPPTPTDLALAAIAAAIPTAADVGSAVASAIYTASGTTTPPTTVSGALGAPGSNFDPLLLPTDVRLRWERHRDRKVVLSVGAGPFTTNNKRWYIDGSDRLILADGTLFLLRTPWEKGLFNDPVTCKDDSPAGVRTWYRNFTMHCMDHGYYCHPLWLFRKNHGGEPGFTFGDTTDDDLPKNTITSIRNMRQAVYRVLQRHDMFPPPSRFHHIVSNCHGDGYTALKNILFHCHPAFHPQPSIMIKSYPSQGRESLLQYYNAFLDFLQMRAYIANIDTSLADKNELDLFINGTRYSAYLNRVTREERTQSTLQHRYAPGQIVETLESFLMQPDSPTMLDDRHAPQTHRSQDSRPTFPRPPQPSRSSYPRPTRVHNIAFDISTDHDAPYDTSMDPITVPQDDDSRALYHIYSACVLKLMSRPNLNSQPCIVCNKEHKFEACPILANTEFLRGHYIRFCQHLRREAASRASVFAGTDANLPLPSPDHRIVGSLGLPPITEYKSPPTTNDHAPNVYDQPPTAYDDHQGTYTAHSQTGPNDTDPQAHSPDFP